MRGLVGSLGALGVIDHQKAGEGERFARSKLID